MSPSRKKFLRKSRFKNRPHADEHRALIADAGASPTQVRVMAYNATDIVEKESPTVADIQDLASRFAVVWVDVSGLQDIAFIQQLGAHFNIHPLVQEDIVRTHQRSKMEDYPEALFLVSRMAPCTDQVTPEQLSLYMTDNCLLTFQEYPGDDLDSVRNRIRYKRGRIRVEAVDYLCYSVVDAVIDAYFPLVDKYGELIEDLEDQLVEAPNPGLIQEIYQVRRRILELRRSLWPQREVMANLYRGECSLIQSSTTVFFRDCYDHTVQLIDLMENYRELSSNLMEVYLSSSGNRMNEIMKVLTIVSSIFIPLTFIAGIYGMNFNTQISPWNMPELNSRYGYIICMAVMLLIALAQLYFFHRKGWLKNNDKTVESAAKLVHKSTAEKNTPGTQH